MTQSASAPRRDRWSRILIMIGAFLIFTAGLVMATARGLLEPGQFAGRIARSLSDDRVAGYVADHLTDVVVAQKPDLIAVRPVILSTMTGIVRSDVFRGVVRAGARSVHRAIFEQAGKQVILSLPDVGTVLRSTLEQARPALAARIPEDLQARLASGESERRAQRVVRILGWGERIRLGAEL